MRIPRRSLNLRVSKQFSDHRQPFADEQSAGRKCVAEIVNAYVPQSGSFTNATPRMLKIGQMRFLLLSHDNVRITGHTRQRFQQRHRRLAKMDGLRASLTIGQAAVLSVLDPRSAIQGSEFQTSRQPVRSRIRKAATAYLVSVSLDLRSCQRLSETLQFLRRQEPLALTFRIAFDILARIGVLVPYPPSLGKIHHLRQDAEGAVCLIGDMRQGAVQLCDVGRSHGANALLGKKWIEEQLDRPPIFCLCRRLAANGDILRKKALSEFLHRCRLSVSVAQRRRIAVGAPYAAELDRCFASRQFRRHDSELPDHHPARPAVTSVLHQEESLPARHDAHAEARKVGIEGDVVLGRDLEAPRPSSW